MTHHPSESRSPRPGHRFGRRRRVTSTLHTLLLTAALVIGGTFVVLPDAADARDEPRTVRSKPSRTSTPPARTSTPPARSSTPRAKPSTPPARSTTPRAKPSTPRAKPSSPPARTATPRAKPAPSPRTSSPPQRGSDHRAGGSDGYTVRTKPAPRTRGGERGERIFNRRTYSDRDRDQYRYGEHRDTRRHRDYGHVRDHYRDYHHNRRGHVHTRYCGHRYFGIGYGWDGFYGYWGYGYRPYHNPWYWRYPWYWEWWPSVHVRADAAYRHDSGAMDLDVRPEKAQIFLDGQYVGRADDYDGFPTYLWLEEGTYDVAFYHPGYETIFRQVTIYPGVVIDFEDRMRPGESIHPEDYGPTSTRRRDARIQRNREKEAAARRAEQRDRWDDVTYGSPPARAPSAESQAASPAPTGDKVGRLYVAVLPSDAAVYLDGHFLGTAGELGQLSAGLIVEPGEHVVELVRPGYATARQTITVPPGEKVAVERELRQE